MRNMTIVYIACFLSACALLLFAACKSKNEASDQKSGKLPHGFSRELDTIRFGTQTLADVDAATFEVVDDCFCKDKNRVFYFNAYRESRDYFISKKYYIQPLERADPAAFVSLGDGYAKDASHAWYTDQTFKVADLEGLTALNRHFAKDKTQAYLDCKPIPGSEGATFQLIDDHYAKDARRWYYTFSRGDGGYEIKVIDCHYESFQTLDYPYAKDLQNVYYRGNKINGARPEGFELLGHRYAKDKNSVYFEDKKIAGADPQTFALFPENEHSLGSVLYAKDKNGVYLNEKAFAAADAPTFRVLNEKYSLDKNGVYCNMKKVKNADPNTFKVYPHYMGDADAEDQYRKYGDGKAVD